jgi:hypothetical protein
MNARCSNPKHIAFPYYGALGVTICERWLGREGFANFLADMGEKPRGMSIDRFPDKGGNYEPTNCRWATATTQSRNRRNIKLTPLVADEIRSLAASTARSDLALRYGVSTSTIKRVIDGAWQPEAA